MVETPPVRVLKPCRNHCICSHPGTRTTPGTTATPPVLQLSLLSLASLLSLIPSVLSQSTANSLILASQQAPPPRIAAVFLQKSPAAAHNQAFPRIISKASTW